MRKGPFFMPERLPTMPYRKLLAATCRDCGVLTMPSGLMRDSHTWSGFQHLCRTCSRARGKAYNKTPERRASWQRRQSGQNAAPHARYRQAHRAVIQAKGKAAEHRCYCGEGASDWALLPLVPRLKDGPYTYSPDPADYIPMCRSHNVYWDSQFRRLRR
ncbi:hypothetical protein GCM10010321_28940 [Streptomyces chartreusis]|nr:hypothetical protein GCM10010321_28940 [Streptomyces chartreusis]